MRYALVVPLLVATLSPTYSRDNGQWDATDADVRRWFQSATMPDNPGTSCCGEADAYYADSFEVEDGQYVAIITDERVVQGRPVVPVGTKVKVPNNKLPNPGVQQPNPTGHGVIFMNGSRVVYCYFPPGGV
jgi:hypothetical protein